MKQGMDVGREESIEIEVTEDMLAAFNGEIVHPVYSTVSMVHHMEWVSRKIILPFLEDHEEGMGAAVQVNHIGPSPLGLKVTIRATLVEHTKNIVRTSVVASNHQGVIGKGEVEQVILPKEVIAKNLEKAQVHTSYMQD